jgi:hypothetical protein
MDLQHKEKITPLFIAAQIQKKYRNIARGIGSRRGDEEEILYSSISLGSRDLLLTLVLTLLHSNLSPLNVTGRSRRSRERACPLVLVLPPSITTTVRVH